MNKIIDKLRFYKNDIIILMLWICVLLAPLTILNEFGKDSERFCKNDYKGWAYTMQYVQWYNTKKYGYKPFVRMHLTYWFSFMVGNDLWKPPFEFDYVEFVDDQKTLVFDKNYKPVMISPLSKKNPYTTITWEEK